jgi:hypothetical protein
MSCMTDPEGTVLASDPQALSASINPAVTTKARKASCGFTAALVGLVAMALPAAVPSSAAAADWSTQTTVNPPGFASAELQDVSCVSAVWCVAVGKAGSNASTTSSGQALAEAWNGTSWSEQSLAPAPGTAPDLQAVSCVSVTFCAAVGNTDGSYDEPGSRNATLAEMWNGTSWTIARTPDSGRWSSLSGVSCTSATFCIAVGFRAARSGQAGSIAEIWNGQRWRMLQTPRFPAVRNVGSDPAELSGVSCTAANACTAVGDYFVRYLTTVPLVDRWNGRRWVVQHAPNENKNRRIYGGVQDTDLSAVSCPTRSACIAIGGLNLDNGVPRKDQPPPFAERWNGVRWSVIWAGGPRGGGFSSVSCVSPRDCTAVGGAIRSTLGTSQPLAESWNGARWTAQSTQAAPGGALLYGISCLSGAACTAVGFGFTNSADDDTGPLAESTVSSTPAEGSQVLRHAGARLAVPVILDLVRLAEQERLVTGYADQDRAVVGVEHAHRAAYGSGEHD